MVGRRQIGSTMKPYVYSLAMENGFSPCDQARHVEYTLIDENGKPWTPRNANKKRYGDMVTVKWGLANSDNWITAYLMSKLNPYELKRLVHSFGVRNREIVPSVSLCLGPCEVSVGEMVSAYTAFPNKGIRVAPLFVTRIEDNDGNVLATFSPEMQEVISASSAYKMLVMLRAVVNEGTGGRVRRLGVKADMGGKTGTTNYNADGWFMGFTPSLVSGCWVGGEDRDIHFDTMLHGQGASMALPIWAKYMVKVLGDKSLGYDENETFQLPEGFDPCKDSGYEDADAEPASEMGLDDLFNKNWEMVYTICIGSNVNRKENLALARKRLSELFPNIRFSAEADTEPLFFRRQALFANQVACFTSDSDAGEVILHLKDIEREAGRTPEEKKQEIVRLDIDLLSCDNRVYKPEDLKRDYIIRGLKELNDGKSEATNAIETFLYNNVVI